MNILLKKLFMRLKKPRFVRAFSDTPAIQPFVSSFYSRAEAEEVTGSSLARTMCDMMRTHISVQEHQKFQTITNELALYLVKVLQQSKKPFVSH